jgi:hypothetical protein
LSCVFNLIPEIGLLLSFLRESVAALLATPSVVLKNGFVFNSVVGWDCGWGGAVPG